MRPSTCAPTWRVSSRQSLSASCSPPPARLCGLYDSLHGASVCAVGLGVENVTGALHRAKGLQIAEFAQPIGPGEMSRRAPHCRFRIRWGAP
jgi:hypothetical protein